VRNRTSNNATRIDLSKAPEQFAAPDEAVENEADGAESQPGGWSGFNPFDWR
jgi:hypothetical protein